MYRAIPYLVLFAVTVLLQVFLFDNLSICIYLNPLVYLAFLLLLPLDTPPVVLLLLGLVVGVTADWAMGAAGLNTIATLFVAFIRPMVFNLLSGRDDAREGGVPCPERLGLPTFLSYVMILTIVHHTVFFVLESLSWAHLLQTVLRIVLSSLITVGFVWIITRIFTSKFPSRI